MKKHSVEKQLSRVKKWEPYSINLNLFRSVSTEVDDFLTGKFVRSLHIDFFIKKEENQNQYVQTFDSDRCMSLIDTVTLPLLYSDVTDERLIRKYLTLAASLVSPAGKVLIPNYGNIDPHVLGDIFMYANTIGSKTIRLTQCFRPKKYDLDMGLVSEIIQDLGIDATVDDFIKKPKLFPHQVEAFQFWDRIGRRGLWALDMGTGKSYTQRYILYKNMFSGTYKNIMVMTLASIIPAWKSEMDRLGIQYLHWSKKDEYTRMKPGVVNVMSIESIGYEQKPRNIEGLELKKWQERWKRKPFLKKLSRVFFPGMFDFIIVDESHKINSDSNLATKMLNHIITSETHVLFSTGTPFSNGLHEAFSQVNLLKPGALGPNITWFRDNMCEDVSKSAQYRQYKLRECYKDKVTQIIYSVAKFQKIVEGITLPPLTVTDIEYTLSEEQQAVQKQIKDEHIIPVTTDLLPNGVPVTTPARAGIILRTLCSAFIEFDFEFPGLPVKEHIKKIFDPDPKREAFTNLIKNLGTSQALIWINSIKTGERLTEYLRSLGYTVDLINSKVSKPQRRIIIQKFLDNKIQFTVAHPQTLGTGLDFLNALYQIVYEMSYSLTEYEQAQKRSHRIGQKNQVIIYRMIGRGSIEKAIGYALDRKISVEDYLFTGYFKDFNFNKPEVEETVNDWIDDDREDNEHDLIY